MNQLKIKSVDTFVEKEPDQGIERSYMYYTTLSSHYITKKQEIDIVQTRNCGKMLFLDKVLQSSTQDEVIYHNALVHSLLYSLEDKSKVLILGGGEGATLREVLRWKAVAHTTMVEYDNELLNIMVKDEYSWAMGAFSDRRAKLIVADAWKYIASCPKFNAVIIDLTDPDIKKDNWAALLKMVMDTVQPLRGGFVMNAGPYIPWNTRNLQDIKKIIENICIQYGEYKYYVYTTFVPSFNSEWAFFVMMHKSRFMVEPEYVTPIPEWIRRNIRILPNTLIDTPANTTPLMTSIA
jgi:spermidine synthase